MLKPLTLALILAATSAHADLVVIFDEGAPKDRFTLTNAGDCALPQGIITVDLGTAPSGLIFDVTASGAGVEVFQPFEVVSGQENLRNMPEVSDGQSAITLDLNGLAPGGAVAFTIDVDDTGGGREITVSGSEIAGATVRIDGAEKAGVFDATAQAIVKLAACQS